MGMGTHVITKVGVVKTTCNKQILFSIITLEKELHDVAMEIKACYESGLTAFLSSFRDEWNRIEGEIRTLLNCLNHNLHTLINTSLKV